MAAMNQRCCNLNRLGRLVLSLLLVASLTVILTHWHQGARGQDCGLCSIQEMPRLLDSVGSLLVVPATQEWTALACDVTPVYSESVDVHQGRAPPQALAS
jgi:hypothetical protein